MQPIPYEYLPGVLFNNMPESPVTVEYLFLLTQTGQIYITEAPTDLLVSDNDEEEVLDTTPFFHEGFLNELIVENVILKKEKYRIKGGYLANMNGEIKYRGGPFNAVYAATEEEVLSALKLTNTNLLPPRMRCDG